MLCSVIAAFGIQRRDVHATLTPSARRSSTLTPSARRSSTLTPKRAPEFDSDPKRAPEFDSDPNRAPEFDSDPNGAPEFDSDPNRWTATAALARHVTPCATTVTAPSRICGNRAGKMTLEPTARPFRTPDRNRSDAPRRDTPAPRDSSSPDVLPIRFSNLLPSHVLQEIRVRRQIFD